MQRKLSNFHNFFLKHLFSQFHLIHSYNFNKDILYVAKLFYFLDNYSFTDLSKIWFLALVYYRDQKT